MMTHPISDDCLDFIDDATGDVIHSRYQAPPRPCEACWVEALHRSTGFDNSRPAREYRPCPRCWRTKVHTTDAEIAEREAVAIEHDRFMEAYDAGYDWRMYRREARARERQV